MNEGKKSGTFFLVLLQLILHFILSLINSGRVLAPYLLLNSNNKSRMLRLLPPEMLKSVNCNPVVIVMSVAKTVLMT